MNQQLRLIRTYLYLIASHQLIGGTEISPMYHEDFQFLQRQKGGQSASKICLVRLMQI